MSLPDTGIPVEDARARTPRPDPPPTRDSRDAGDTSMRRASTRNLLLLAALGVTACPPGRTATMLRGDEVPPTLVTGLWLGKACLLAAIAALALVLHRFRAPHLARAATVDAATVDATTADVATPRTSPRERWGLALLTLAALVIRLPGLDAGLWFDEIQTQVEYVRLPWGVLLTTFDSTNQHLLFSIAARAVQALGGESAFTLRLPAVLFGVASIPAAFWFARRWLPAREAWWSTLLLAFSYHHVWFSQNARGYTGQLLGTLLSSALFLDLLRGERSGARRGERPGAGTIVAYAAAVTVMLLSHVTGLVVVATHGLCWLWRARTLPAGPVRWAPVAGLVLAGLFTASCLAPVLPQLFSAVGGSGESSVPIAWQNPAWFLAEAVRALTRGLPGGVVLVPAAALVGVLGLWLAWRRDRVATVLMVLPLVLMAAIVLSTGHNIWPRFFFFGAAFLVQLAVRGGFGVLETLAAALRRAGAGDVATAARRVGDATLALATLGFLVVLPAAWGPKQDFEAAVAYVEAQRKPGDAVVVTDLTRFPVRRWMGRDWAEADDAATLRAAESLTGTTWVLYTFPIRLSATFPTLWERLQREYRPARVIPSTVGGGEIVIVSRPPFTTSRPQ